jgi:putative hydrolase of HD superfamily
MKRIAHFLFEAGMLKRTPRSGWQYLGSGGESVADHVFRTAMITYALAQREESVDRNRCLELALVHDLPEARTGDLNYMNQKYAEADEARAAADLSRELPFGDQIEGLLSEYREETSAEAILVHDADQLELLMSLKEQLDLGNHQANDWIPFVLRRLRTDSARALADAILAGHSADWWFDRGSEWWVRGGKG